MISLSSVQVVNKDFRHFVFPAAERVRKLSVSRQRLLPLDEELTTVIPPSQGSNWDCDSVFNMSGPDRVVESTRIQTSDFLCYGSIYDGSVDDCLPLHMGRVRRTYVGNVSSIVCLKEVLSFELIVPYSSTDVPKPSYLHHMATLFGEYNLREYFVFINDFNLFSL